MTRTPRKPLRTFFAAEHKAGRFRPETVERTERPPVSATLAERVIARQLERLDESRDDAE